MSSPARTFAPIRSAQSWIERLARLGYASKGLVYLIMGALTAAAGIGERHGKSLDRKSAIDFIASMPLGRMLLVLMSLGLLGYALWRVISGFADSDDRGTDLKGLLLRAGSILRGLFYAAFAIGLLRFGLHQSGSGRSSDTTSRHWASRAMDHPYGRLLIATVGLSLIGYGIAQLVRALRGKLDRHLQWSGVTPATHAMLVRVCCFGIAARALVFGMIGLSLARAAFRRDPAAAHGTSGAFRELEALPFGGWLLTAAGLGFVAYGVYALINARFRSIRAS